MEKSIALQLAEKIARDVFEIGDEPNSPTQRMQFIGGEYPDNEKTQGGLCEAAFSEAIAKSINRHLSISA